MSQEKTGIIVGEAETGSFVFVSDLDSYPPKHEYLVVRDVREREGQRFKKVDVLAQVTRISNSLAD